VTVTVTAAAAEQACRDLRLSTIRARAQEMLTAAE